MVRFPHATVEYSVLFDNSNLCARNSSATSPYECLQNSKKIYLESSEEDSKEISEHYLISFGNSAFLDRIKEFQNNHQNDISSTDPLPLQMQYFEQSTTTSNTSDIHHPQLSLKHKERLLSKIRNCYFEAGLWTLADAYFDELINIYGSVQEPLKLLSDIVNHNLSDQHLLEGALHILSNYDYVDITPIGVTIALCCTVNQSPVIQELLINCFEVWNAIDAIDILQSLKLDIAWIDTYRNEVIELLQASTQEV